MDKLDVAKEIQELKTQLAYAKNIGFFFGAGTSCALKIPDIATLTTSVEKALAGDAQKHFATIRVDLASGVKKINIEDILNQTRRIREITGERSDKNYMGISGDAAKALDAEICKKIYQTITESEEKADLTSPTKFFAWLNLRNREYSKEIFTTNYDLVVERALEASQIPYFDGFVGAYEPFFWQESIDQLIGQSDLTKNWIRLWKIHGSLSWFWKPDPKDGSQKIIRVGKFDKASHLDQELVIYPSREKYDRSRKQPFIAYLDRLKNYLSSGELLFVFTGYSFGDQHINEIIFNGLRQNQRLTCVVFVYDDAEVAPLLKIASSYMNLNVFAPTRGIVNGTLFEWEFDSSAKTPHAPHDYYDDKAKRLKLGDFNELVNFLITLSGNSDPVAGAKP